MPATARPRLCRVSGREAWHIYDARRRISTGCTSRAEAELVLSRYLAEIERPAAPIIAISDILARYLTTRREANIPGLDRLEWAHKPLVRIVGQKPPAAIVEADCTAYAKKRRQEGVADATIRTELQALRAALVWAFKPPVKLIAELPVITMPPRPEARQRWLTRAEADKLIAACKSHHIRLFTITALNTGARSGAILALTWDRVDLENRLIDFREPGRVRTKKRRVPAPINDTLHAALTEAHQGSTSEFVIEWAGGRIDKIKHGFRDAAARAGLRGVSPHVLRHTAVTWMMQRGVPAWEAAGFVGMDVDTLIETYGHHDPEHGRRAARALG